MDSDDLQDNWSDLFRPPLSAQQVRDNLMLSTQPLVGDNLRLSSSTSLEQFNQTSLIERQGPFNSSDGKVCSMETIHETQVTEKTTSPREFIKISFTDSSQSSPRISPRISPRSPITSPKSSPRLSPKQSPRLSPKSSPRLSPKISPRILSPILSPKISPISTPRKGKCRSEESDTTNSNSYDSDIIFSINNLFETWINNFVDAFHTNNVSLFVMTFVSACSYGNTETIVNFIQDLLQEQGVKSLIEVFHCDILTLIYEVASQEHYFQLTKVLCSCDEVDHTLMYDEESDVYRVYTHYLPIFTPPHSSNISDVVYQEEQTYSGFEFRNSNNKAVDKWQAFIHMNEEYILHTNDRLGGPTDFNVSSREKMKYQKEITNTVKSPIRKTRSNKRMIFIPKYKK
jgi:hypothetical protein